MNKTKKVNIVDIYGIFGNPVEEIQDKKHEFYPMETTYVYAENLFTSMTLIG